jgi:hypothetical protein
MTPIPTRRARLFLLITALFLLIASVQSQASTIQQPLVNQQAPGSDGDPAGVTLAPVLSEDGLILFEPTPRLVLVVDPLQATQGVKIPRSERNTLAPETATFSITFISAGGTDKWGEPCLAFPAQAQTAFNYAASIWASELNSSVPITIRACWANLGSSSILGYSGGNPLHRDFAGAPVASTWYFGSLANAIYGSDLNTTDPDMHITYNTNFSWYYGTDGNPPAGTYDLVTVAAHEIAHGLNFAGSASVSGTTGSYGISGFPVIFDRFMRDGSGTLLTDYTNPSAALKTLLTSNNLWFHGANAMAANGGSRVKMYAPSTWVSGSSYSHLDYSTFVGTINSMMVYSISSGSSNHNPGPVTLGLFQDLGWPATPAPPSAPTGVSASDGAYSDRVRVTWNSSSGATSYHVHRATTAGGTKTDLGSTAGTSFDDFTATPGTTYYYWVTACNDDGCSDFSAYDTGYRLAPPSAPSGVAASDGTFTDKVQVSWNASAGATSYQVYRNTTNNSSGATMLAGSHPASPYNDTSAVPGTLYYYWVKACNLAGCSSYSSSNSGYRAIVHDVFLPLVMRDYSASGGWVEIMSEDFEGDFPAGWWVGDGNGTNAYYWGKRNCQAYEGSFSGWAVGAGTQGSLLNCGANYPNNANSWMIYGPFSLVGAQKAELNLAFWIYTQSTDYLMFLASTDGVNFYGYQTSGNSGGWQPYSFDLTAFGSLGDLTGQPQVWIGFLFDSDGSTNYHDGAFLDNIVLRKCESDCPAARLETGGFEGLSEVEGIQVPR